MLPGKHRLIDPLLLMVLPALVRQQGNALRNTSPPSTSNGEGLTIPSQSPQNLRAWLPHHHQELPTPLLPLTQGRPASLLETAFKGTAPLPPARNDQRTAAVLWAISRTSENHHRREEAALGQPCTKENRGHPSAPSQQQRNPQGTPRRGICPTRAQGDAGGPGAGRVGTQLSFKALRVPH